MIRKASRIVQSIRDAILVVMTVALISTSIGPGKEAVNYIFAGICGLILALTIINIILNALRVQGKGYFRGNSIFQLFIGIFLLGLFPPLGIVLIILSVAVLATLYEKKTPEELLKHPPKPITRKYRAIVGVGVLVTFVGILFSWLNSINFPLIGVYLGTADLAQAAGLVSSPLATIFGLLALVAAPCSLILGLLGLFKRTFAWAGGILAVVAGIGWIVSMTTLTGIGAFVFTIGGAIILTAPIITK